MDITKTDIVLIAGMALAVFGMSFTFPQLGLTTDSHEVNETDVPEFNLSKGEFDFADDLPEFPVRPDSGVLNSSSDKFDNSRGSIQHEIGTDSDGNRTFLVAIDNNTVHIADVTNGSTHSSTDFTANDRTKTLTHDGLEIDVHSVDISAGAGEFEYEVTNRPGDSTVFGSLFNTADKVANVLGFLVISFIVLSQMIIEGALNIGNALFNIATFVVDFLHFTLSTYRVVLDAAPANWAKVFILTPMVILFAEFMKLSIITVNTLKPT